eukprot:TRINITY_DN27888_c0_g1_i1.p1 TRINITY_DN27888_c0_g1~~TRINITY_DN27888_c0_g1_i1.p1  ORF type:complete len:420 (+),score=38.56 TRINITY_DN27888_c0_g1_i1:359-1618(+)
MGGPDPTPKSFRLKWKWGEDAIESELGGRRRGDWRIVRFVCEQLCSKFPGKLALVVCDGFSGFNDDEAAKFFDGTSPGYRKVDYKVWPWTDDVGEDSVVQSNLSEPSPENEGVFPREHDISSTSLTRQEVAKRVTEEIKKLDLEKQDGWSGSSEANRMISTVRQKLQALDPEDRFDEENRLRRYLKGLHDYERVSVVWESMLPQVRQLPHMERGHLVVSCDFEALLYDFNDRPVKLGSMSSGELAIWESAVCLPWKLWPDSMTGHTMVLDYLAENAALADLKALRPSTIDILKAIAQTSRWPNNPMWGMMTSSAAKSILARASRGSSFAEVSTVPIVSAVHNHGRPSQPPRSAKKAFQAGVGHWGRAADLRRVCNRSGCTEVESGTTKFQVCSGCRKVSYCSRACQKIDWKSGHKASCV